MTFYRGTDPRIRIQILTKTPLIRNTGRLPVVLLILWICGLRWSCYRWWNRLYLLPVTCVDHAYVVTAKSAEKKAILCSCSCWWYVHCTGAVDQGTSSTRFLVFVAETGQLVTYHQLPIQVKHLLRHGFFRNQNHYVWPGFAFNVVGNSIRRRKKNKLLSGEFWLENGAFFVVCRSWINRGFKTKTHSLFHF